MATDKYSGARLLRLIGLFAFIVFLSLRFGLETVEAARVSDIRGTKHNLSAYVDGTAYTNPTAGAGTYPVRNIKATGETQLCVFCHTPHGASTSARPLWNRKVAGDALYTQSYVLYDSSTLDAKQVQGSLSQPGGSSKLCLSCHDGTVAVGNVNVLNGLDTSANAKTVATIPTSGSTFMPTGAGATTGFTRNLGTDLSNDHPISITYNDTTAGYDGELRTPSANPTLMGVRTPTVKPKLKLEATGPAGNVAQIQCATCHDPHIRETTEATVGNQKFLRLNRFQHQDPPSSSGYNTADNTGDIICLACHDKAGASWAFSAHANSAVADEAYSNTHADRREFPRNLKVWQAACLNCHDTHTVSGSRRLLREGTNEGSSTAVSGKAGGTNTGAIEETCYQCHDNGTNGTLQVYTNVPNIQTDFTTAGNKRMPITTAAQGTSGGGGGNTAEVHDISSVFNDGIMVCGNGAQCGKDLMEPRSLLGVGNLKNRHAECTDCHNPHRVIRGASGLPGALNSVNTSNAKVNGASGGHHSHTDAAGYTHTNVISGVLRGSWGVQPTYTDASFNAALNTITYAVKRGDPGNATVTDCAGASKAGCDTASYVTREYQICFKCHSDYGYSDDNSYPTSTNRPQLGGTGLTAKNVSNRVADSYVNYTNQAKEFQAPVAHRGEPLTKTDSGAGASYSTNNHRSWHPVQDSTGRDVTSRGGISANNWRAPFNNAVGSQTMYCTDCHGSATAGTTAIPTGTSPWGPHGSANDFLLKGPWTINSGSPSTTDLCFRCHDPGIYANGNGTKTGFYIGSRGSGISKNNDGHKVHQNKIGSMKCNWCHVAVPHGWKNKALLVNLNDVGPEAGQAAAGVVIADNSSGYSNGPYYRRAMLKVKTFAKSGDWAIGDCGPAGSNESGSQDWMKNGICKNPP